MSIPLIWSFIIYCLLWCSHILYECLIDVRAHHYRYDDTLHVWYVRNYLDHLFRGLALRCPLAFPFADLTPLQFLQNAFTLKPTGF